MPAPITARLTRIETSSARVVNAETGALLGYVVRDDFGNRTWAAKRTRNLTPFGRGYTRADAVAILVARAERMTAA